MAGCRNNEIWFQDLMSATPIDEFPPGVDPSILTCSFMADDDGCGGNDPSMFDVVCARSCHYHGPCTGDGALNVLFSDDDDDENGSGDDEPMTCAMMEVVTDVFTFELFTNITDVDDPDVFSMTETLFSIARKICGLPPASRRARKMTDAPPVDASKVHKLAAAMLRSAKTMAHRLAQVAVSQPPRHTPTTAPYPPPPLPSTPSHLHPPTAPSHTSFVLPCTSYFLFPLRPYCFLPCAGPRAGPVDARRWSVSYRWAHPL